MKHFLLLYITIIYSNNIVCQIRYLPLRPYEQLKFTELKPLWYSSIIDTSVISTECNGFNRLNFSLRCKTEVKDGYIYTPYQTIIPGETAGTYLEKRNIHNGKMEWNFMYGYKDVAHPEVARSIIFEQDSVRLLSWRSKDSFYVGPTFALAGIGVSMTERSFSDASGQLGSYLTTMPGDTTAKKFTANPIFVNKVEYILKDPNNDGYRCIYHEVFTNPRYILSVPLDRYGRQIGQTDTVICDRLKSFFVNTVNDKKILLNKRNGEKMFMVLYEDASLKKEEDVWELESFDVVAPSLLLSIDGENTIWSHNPNSDNEVISVYLRDKLVSKVAMPLEYHYNTFTFVNDRAIGIVGYDFIANKQDIIEIVGNQIKVVKTLLSEDPLRYFLAWDLIHAENLLILHAEEGSFFINQQGNREQDYPSKANSIMAFSLESLGLVSGTSDAHQIKGNMDVYPNPSENVIHITVHSSNTKHLEIRNLLGNVMENISTHNTDTHNIDVSAWPSGMYIISGDHLDPKTFVKI
jgi:hypothetical protein